LQPRRLPESIVTSTFKLYHQLVYIIIISLVVAINVKMNYMVCSKFWQRYFLQNGSAYLLIGTLCTVCTRNRLPNCIPLYNKQTTKSSAVQI